MIFTNRKLLSLSFFLFLFLSKLSPFCFAEMTDPLQTRITQGIVSKIFPEATKLGPPEGDPPYIPVIGKSEEIAVDERKMARWRIEFLQTNAREPTKKETQDKIDSFKTTGSQQTIGYLFSTYETTKARGYSGDHFDIISGIRPDGRLAGSVIVELHEPMICPTCVPQTKLDALYKTFENINVNKRAKVNMGDSRGYDGVSGATISATMTTNAIITGARKVSRMVNVGNNSDNTSPFYLDLDSYKKKSWKELLDWGGIQGIKFSKSEIVKMLNESGVKLENIIKPNATFLEIYAGIATPAHIGRNLFGDQWYSFHLSKIDANENLLIILGSDGWSWKGNNFRRTNKYDRILLLQEDKKFEFTADEFVIPTAIRSEGRPKISEIGLFRIPKNWGFDPLKKWTLKIKIEHEFAEGFVDLKYTIPKELITGDQLALEDAGLRPTKKSFFGLVRQSKLSGWKEEWGKEDSSIIILILLLITLTLILMLQKSISLHRSLHKIIRLSFLSIVLIWLGWIAGAQLSIVNIISYVESIVLAKGFSQFLFEPLIAIIFVYTLVSLILLGRGVFCGWLCPFGALQELLYQLARAVNLPKIKIPFYINERLWALKYILVIAILVFTVKGGPSSEQIIEIEPFKTAITSYFNRSLPYVLYTLTLIGIGLFSERFFCRFICPLGGVLAFLGRLHIFNMIPRRVECGNPCHLCEQSCPVQAIATNGKINMNECFQCLDCEVEYFDSARCPPLKKINNL